MGAVTGDGWTRVVYVGWGDTSRYHPMVEQIDDTSIVSRVYWAAAPLLEGIRQSGGLFPRHIVLDDVQDMEPTELVSAIRATGYDGKIFYFGKADIAGKDAFQFDPKSDGLVEKIREVWQ
ncbi:MAG: hypothetical protein HGA85_04710 [Nanoarchaeota archaeon]|nr:hypothetical protein [Nanoarchaeota archaeon]